MVVLPALISAQLAAWPPRIKPPRPRPAEQMRSAEEVRYLILAAQREGNRQLAQALRPLGLTPSQAEVLRLLGDRQPLTLTGLGELLVCESGTNPSRLVDRLVTAGLVHRTESPHDRRQVALTLSGVEVQVAATWRPGRPGR